MCLLVAATALLGCVSSETSSEQDLTVTEREEDLGEARAALEPFTVKLWSNATVSYRYDEGVLGPKAVPQVSRNRVRAAMDAWEAALSTEHSGVATTYVHFVECMGACPDESTLIIRIKDATDSGMSAPIGMEPNDGLCEQDPCPTAKMVMRIYERLQEDDHSTLLHELGHVLGLAHEHRRADRDRWLHKVAGVNPPAGNEYGASPLLDTIQPLVGPYDIDSVMQYSSYSNPPGEGGTLYWRDHHERTFSRWISGTVSPLDVSRVLQYYARKAHSRWGFFRSMSDEPAEANALPEPGPASGVTPVGTPAIAFRSPGNYDLFTRGSDNHTYWRPVRGEVPGAWQSLGCCSSSDPSAVYSDPQTLEVAFVGADTGKVMVKTMTNDTWGPAFYVPDGHPAGGVRKLGGEHLGPALASRSPGNIDLFVVRADGDLAVNTRIAGAWSGFSTFAVPGGVTARPAAVALSDTRVQLAVNAGGTSLYEPKVTFWFAGPFLSAAVGPVTGDTAPNAAPGIAKRDSDTNPYRVLVVNSAGRISHRFASGAIRDMGGLPKPGTGISAVTTGPYKAHLLMLADDARGCFTTCLSTSPTLQEARVQSGGLWLRELD
ncbi:MAG: M12 family metallopeptidase [Polyangiaceae bacterium]